MDILLTINSVTDLITAICLILIISRWKKIPMGLRWFCFFLILALITQVTAKIWVWWLHYGNNLFLLHIYTFFEFIFLSLFYKQLLHKNAFFQKYHLYFIFGISLLIVLNTVFLQPWIGFNNNAKTLTQVIYIGYAVAYFFQEAATIDKNAQQRLLTLINSAILLYYAGSLFIFMFSSTFTSLDDFVKVFWIANALLYLIFQLLVFIGLWIFRQRTKSIGS